MKKLFFILLLSCMTIAVAHAQDTKPRTNAGDKSLNFSINGLGTFGVTGPLIGTTPLGNTLGDSLLTMLGQLVGTSFVRPIYGVGATIFLSDNLGLRIGIGFNYLSNSTPIAGDTSGREDTDSKSAFAISPALQVHLANAGPVTVYTGAVFTFATASTTQGEDTLARSSSQTGLGGGAILGAQFFPWENISLGIESQFGVAIRSTSTETKGKSTDGASTLELGFMLPISVNLGIHF